MEPKLIKFPSNNLQYRKFIEQIKTKLTLYYFYLHEYQFPLQITLQLQKWKYLSVFCFWDHFCPANVHRLQRMSPRKMSVLKLPRLRSGANFTNIFHAVCVYSQTCANDYLQIATSIFRSNFELLVHKWPLNNDHPSTKDPFWGSKDGRCTQVWLYRSYPSVPRCCTANMQLLCCYITCLYSFWWNGNWLQNCL